MMKEYYRSIFLLYCIILMRTFTLFLIGIIVGAGALFYGYIRLEQAKTDEYITQTHSSIITKLQGVQQLATARMTIQKVIE